MEVKNGWGEGTQTRARFDPRLKNQRGIVPRRTPLKKLKKEGVGETYEAVLGVKGRTRRAGRQDSRRCGNSQF